MNKRILSEQVLRILEGGDTDSESELDIREVELIVGQILATKVQDYLFQLNKAERRTNFAVPEDFLANKEVDLVDNKVELPFVYLSLPHGRGIYEVYQVDDCDEYSTIYPLKARRGLVGNLESYDMQGNLAYSVTGRMFSVFNGDCDKVGIDYIPNPSNQASEEELAIPDFLFNDVIKSSIETLAPHIEIPEDLKQDNADNKITNQHGK